LRSYFFLFFRNEREFDVDAGDALLLGEDFDETEDEEEDGR